MNSISHIFSLLFILVWPVQNWGEEAPQVEVLGSVYFSDDGTPAGGVRVTFFKIPDLSRSVGGFTDEKGHFTILLESPISSSTVPRTFRLQQNFPNPFNPGTTIQYSLPAAGAVSLKIYDMAGQVVRQLVDQHQNAGTRRYGTVWTNRGRRRPMGCISTN